MLLAQTRDLGHVDDLVAGLGRAERFVKTVGLCVQENVAVRLHDQPSIHISGPVNLDTAARAHASRRRLRPCDGPSDEAHAGPLAVPSGAPDQPDSRRHMRVGLRD